MRATQLTCFGLLGLLASQPAFAHSPIEGIGNFYNGLLHPILVPAHCLVLIATGIFIGQRRIENNRPAFIAFLVTLTLGLSVSWFSALTQLEGFLLAAAVVLGLLVAANLSVGLLINTLLAALVGFFIGFDSAQETLQGQEKFFALLGTALGIYVLLSYALIFTEYCNKKPWQQIGVRVVGSWVAASSFLVLALAFSVAATK